MFNVQLPVQSASHVRPLPHGERTQRICQRFVWLSLGLYIFCVLRLTFHWQNSVFGYDTGFDIAIFDQATWLISKGHAPFVTVRGLHILADHFSVILYLLAPLYWVWSDPKTLLAAQTIALALGSLPVYALARERADSAPIGLLFAVSYLLYPSMQWSNAYEFHPDTFATPLLLAAFLFLTRRQWLLYFSMLTLAAVTKESVGLTLVALGLYVIFVNWRIGLLTIGFGVLTIVTALTTIRYFNNGASSGYYWLYAKYGGSLPAIALYLVTHPAAVAIDLLTGSRSQYLCETLQPLLFLPLIAPEVLLIAVPALLTNLLSSRNIMHTLEGGYYASAITPFVFVAAIIGFSRLQQRFNAVGKVILSVNLAIWSLAGVTQGALWHSLQPHDTALTLDLAWQKRSIQEAYHALSMIPPATSVSAQASLVSHLSHRREIYTFPNPFFQRAWGNSVEARQQMEIGAHSGIQPTNLDTAITQATVEYIVFCPYTRRFPLSDDTFTECMAVLLKNPAYGVIYVGNSMMLLRRSANYHHGIVLLAQQVGVPIHTKADIENAFRLWLKNQPLPP